MVGSTPIVAQLRDSIHSTYPLKDLGELRDAIFLGLHIVRTTGSFVIDQHRYCLGIADKFLISSSDASHIPIVTVLTRGIRLTRPIARYRALRRAIGG